MGRIYNRASIVFVWFGKPTREADAVLRVFQWITCQDMLAAAVMSHMSRIEDAIDTSSVLGVQHHSFNLHRTSRILLSQYGFSCEQLTAFKMLVDGIQQLSKDKSSLGKADVAAFVAGKCFMEHLFPPTHWFWEAFMKLLGNPWFFRVWTMQEILLARLAWVLCPKGVFAFHTLEEYTRILVSIPGMSVIWPFTNLMVQGVPFDTVVTAVRVATQVRLPVPCRLSHLLQQISQRRATVKSDYVYALLGVVDPATLLSIRVDYGLPASIVFAIAFKAAIMRPEDAAQLPRLWEYFELILKTIPGLPTWCPDWSNAHGIAALVDSIRHPTVDSSVIQAYSSVARIDICVSDIAKLGFAGYRLETIKRSIKTYFRSHFADSVNVALQDALLAEQNPGPSLGLSTHFPKPMLLSLRKWLHACIDMLESSGDDFMLQLKSLINAISPVPPIKKFHMDPRDLLHFCEFLIAEGNVQEVDIFEAFNVSEEKLTEIADTFMKIQTSLDRKFVFETTSGKIGFCRRLVYPNDQVVYVPGGKMFHVLSSNGTRYRGTAYVRGLMRDSLLGIPGGLDDKLDMFYLT